eukprot:9004353-Alexandrium_andersonii.AAC.1
MDRGMAVFDLAVAVGQPAEIEGSIGLDDADITDIADFRAADATPDAAVSERSDVRRTGTGMQPYRDDITGAVLDPELVAAARSEEIRLRGVLARVGRPPDLR